MHQTVSEGKRKQQSIPKEVKTKSKYKVNGLVTCMFLNHTKNYQNLMKSDVFLCYLGWHYRVSLTSVFVSFCSVASDPFSGDSSRASCQLAHQSEKRTILQGRSEGRLGL